MYAWHLKKVQIKHMPILYSAFLIIVFVLWNYLKQIPDTASEEQLKVHFACTGHRDFSFDRVSDIGFNCIFGRGRGQLRQATRSVFSCGMFFLCILLLVVSLVVIRFCIINEQCANGWCVMILQLVFMRMLIFTLSCTRLSILGL